MPLEKMSLLELRGLSEVIDALCRAAGLRSAVNYGEMELDARQKNLRALDNASLDVLWNVQLHTEGTDVTATKAVILCRPTLSHALAFQMIGRGMRPAVWCCFFFF